MTRMTHNREDLLHPHHPLQNHHHHHHPTSAHLPPPLNDDAERKLSYQRVMSATARSQYCIHRRHSHRYRQQPPCPLAPLWPLTLGWRPLSQRTCFLDQRLTDHGRPLSPSSPEHYPRLPRPDGKPHHCRPCFPSSLTRHPQPTLTRQLWKAFPHPSLPLLSLYSPRQRTTSTRSQCSPTGHEWGQRTSGLPPPLLIDWWNR